VIQRPMSRETLRRARSISIEHGRSIRASASARVTLGSSHPGLPSTSPRPARVAPTGHGRPARSQRATMPPHAQPPPSSMPLPLVSPTLRRVPCRRCDHALRGDREAESDGRRMRAFSRGWGNSWKVPASRALRSLGVQIGRRARHLLALPTPRALLLFDAERWRRRLRNLGLEEAGASPGSRRLDRALAKENGLARGLR